MPIWSLIRVVSVLAAHQFRVELVVERVLIRSGTSVLFVLVRGITVDGVHRVDARVVNLRLDLLHRLDEDDTGHGATLHGREHMCEVDGEEHTAVLKEPVVAIRGALDCIPSVLVHLPENDPESDHGQHH